MDDPIHPIAGTGFTWPDTVVRYDDNVMLEMIVIAENEAMMLSSRQDYVKNKYIEKQVNKTNNI